MVLENKKARTFDCQECDYNLQIQRNCNNQYSPAKIILNQNLYTQCPKSIISNNRELRYLVDTYFECRENKNYPIPGSIYNQTAFTVELFDFLDDIVNNYRNRKHQEQLNQVNQSNKDNKLRK
jgi:hypothetical protein